MSFMAPQEEQDSNGVPEAAFGDPDGSRIEIDDAVAGFVRFDGRSSVRGLAVSESSKTRVVVGGKGTGKSRYLRRFAAAMLEEPAVYVDELIKSHADVVQKDAPSTLAVVKVSHSVEDTFLTERWSLIWKRAIFRSLVSHLLHSDKLSPYLDEEQRRELENDYTPELYRTFKRPLSIYSQATEIIGNKTRSSLPQYLEDYRWHDLEGLLGEIVRIVPPLYFYIDAIDDEYAHAPLYWLRCQKGLFYTVMKLAKDELFGARLHVVICVRDHVLSSVLRGEHASRYRDSPFVRSLSWDEGSLRFFMRAKLAALPPEYFADPAFRGEDLVAAWLGSTNVWNEDRGISEGIERYLLRHTRLNPRDIVQLGNRLTERIVKCKSLGMPWEEEELRAVVGQLAAEWGEEQLTICAQQMAADMMPAHAADQDYGEVFTGALAYVPIVSQTLRTFLTEAIGVDRFDREFFAYAREMAAGYFDERTDVFSVLWQNGLLGYGVGEMEGGTEHFYRIKERSNSFLVPYDADFYVLHSCLIDAAGIEPFGQRPVLGFRIGG
jgi:hypothetical protein